MVTLRRDLIRYPRSAQPQSLTPRQVAAAYHFPIGAATGRGYVGGIIELGGGFLPRQVAQYFVNQNLPVPMFTSVPVDGGSNTPDGANGADGEVQLDMIIAGAVAPAATYRVYFAPNTDSGFLAAIHQARTDGCRGISISWGGPESSWPGATMELFEKEIGACRAAGIPVFVAAGDTGSQDSSGKGDQTDFPASAPSAIGCGGTRLTVAGGARASEVTWDDDDLQSATGGGVSKHFPGRQVPDVAGNADPDTGYQVMIDGQTAVIGGTSAVAPLMLGLHALLWELNAGKAFDFLNLVVTNPQACFDVTVGDNGGYRAGPGRDPTTGWGVPDGAKLLAALTSGIPAPAPPTPAPPVTTTLADFPTAAVDAWLEHKHSHTQIEAAAAAAIAAFAAAHGITVG